VTPPSSLALDSSTVRQDLDYDWLVVGSGFGGSVAALRLAEKGYRVGLIEAGRRITDDDMPRSTWDLKRYFWAPKLGMRGIFRLTLFRDVGLQHDLTALDRAVRAEDPLAALAARVHGRPGLLKTWRAARRWRGTVRSESHT